jgi:hypothetical protein
VDGAEAEANGSPRRAGLIIADAPAGPSRTATGRLGGVCRSIKTLRRPDEPATEEEIRAAALQFVRKVSGYRAPSRANAQAFDAAVEEIGEASRKLLDAVAKPGRRAG